MSRIALLGGTGALGLGLGMRWAAAGQPIVIGSRSAERAQAAAESVRAAVPSAVVTGGTNQEAAAEGAPVVLCVPFEGLAELMTALRPALAGKVVVDAIVPLAFSKKFCGLETIAGAGSVSEWLQAFLPDAKVVSAFKNLPASTLQDLSQTFSADALLCGDDKEAREAVATLTAYGFAPNLVADCGVAGVHRLLATADELADADSIIVVAGMEGALASLVGGIAACPVVAVPTSVGYGAALEGVTALLAMLATCAAGITVVGIDNGFGAACAVARLLGTGR
jgi:NADPH-dependent F420 reductase